MVLNFTPHEIVVDVGVGKQLVFPSAGVVEAVTESQEMVPMWCEVHDDATNRGLVKLYEPAKYTGVRVKDTSGTIVPFPWKETDEFVPSLIVSDIAAAHMPQWYKDRVPYYRPNTNPGHCKRNEKQQIVSVSSLIAANPETHRRLHVDYSSEHPASPASPSSVV